MPLAPAPGTEKEVINRAVTASLVENASFDISGLEDEKARFKDVRRVNGKVYSETPPGFAIASAPFYAIARIFLGAADAKNLTSGLFILRFVLSTIPILLLGIWLYSSEVDAFSLGVLLFATPLFPLSLLYTSEIFVAVLIYLAFRVLFDFDRIMPGRCFTSGLFLGFCLLCDIRSILPITVFFIGLMFSGRRELRARLLYFLGAVLPFGGVLIFYSWYVLGSATAFLPASSLIVPGSYSIYEQLLSPAKGIFAFSPVLLFTFAAIFTTKSGGSLRFGVKYSLIILAIVLSMFYRPAGGEFAIPATSLGFVLLLFLDPLFDGESDEYSNLWRGFFFTLALLMCVTPVLSTPFAPAELVYPHNSFWRPLLFEKQVFAPTILGWFGVSGPYTLIFPGASVLLILFAVFRTSRYPARFAVGALAGLLPFEPRSGQGQAISGPDLVTMNQVRRSTVPVTFRALLHFVLQST